MLHISLKFMNILSKTWPRGFKTFFMLNSAEHEICPANSNSFLTPYEILPIPLKQIFRALFLFNCMLYVVYTH